VTSGSFGELKAALPGVSIIQVIHVTGPESVEEAMTVATSVDAILLDSGNQSLSVKELGGTGRRHDWNLSRKIREQVRVPIFLAGGLKAENVGEAIGAVQPFGLDLCSGVRTDGKLDPEKLGKFFAAVKTASA
jgi:phosphoribosylanthranilate isomerase